MTQPPKNYSGTKNKILFFVSGIAAGIALTTGLYVHAQTASILPGKVPVPVWDGKIATVGSIAQLTSDQFTTIAGRLDYIQKLINDLQDTCAAR